MTFIMITWKQSYAWLISWSIENSQIHDLYHEWSEKLIIQCSQIHDWKWIHKSMKKQMHVCQWNYSSQMHDWYLRKNKNTVKYNVHDCCGIDQVKYMTSDYMLR